MQREEAKETVGKLQMGLGLICKAIKDLQEYQCDILIKIPGEYLKVIDSTTDDVPKCIVTRTVTEEL